MKEVLSPQEMNILLDIVAYLKERNLVVNGKRVDEVLKKLLRIAVKARGNNERSIRKYEE